MKIDNLVVPVSPFNGRFQQVQGANVASANNLTLGSDGNYFVITGTTQINLINSTGWTPGTVFWLGFTGTLTIKNNQVASGANAKILCSGGLDIGASAGKIVQGVYDGTNFNLLSFN